MLKPLFFVSGLLKLVADAAGLPYNSTSTIGRFHCERTWLEDHAIILESDMLALAKTSHGQASCKLRYLGVGP
jgi:hypothetical protein